MRKIAKEELAEILDKHGKWLRDEEGGELADLRSADLRSANLRGSDLRGSDLRGSDLSYSNLRGSDLRGSDLSYSNLSYSDLSYSNLSYSDLRGSNLRGSNLSYSNLRGSDLRGSTGQHYITQRTDGYQFFLVLDESEKWMILAGCQYMSIEDYRKHTESYDSEEKRTETNLILDFAEAKLNAMASKEKAA